MLNLPIHPSKRHPLTGEPLTAVGFSRRGPIWPIIGASEDQADVDTDETSEDATNEGDDKPEDKPDEHRQATREAAKFRRELKPWKELSKELNLTPEQVRTALAKAAKPAKDLDAEVEVVDADEIKRAAKVEARQESDARLIRSEVKALAAESFTNPADALHNLDLSDYEVDEDGELVDSKQVKTDLAEILKSNPHYSKTGKAPKPDRSQGGKDGQKVETAPGIARLRQAYSDSSK